MKKEAGWTREQLEKEARAVQKQLNVARERVEMLENNLRSYRTVLALLGHDEHKDRRSKK